ncbi:MAG: hypothetical protein WBB28_01410 [Crinalium sp.]
MRNYDKMNTSILAIAFSGLIASPTTPAVNLYVQKTQPAQMPITICSTPRLGYAVFVYGARDEDLIIKAVQEITKKPAIPCWLKEGSRLSWGFQTAPIPSIAMTQRILRELKAFDVKTRVLLAIPLQD